jgi:hypothetical protein
VRGCWKPCDRSWSVSYTDTCMVYLTSVHWCVEDQILQWLGLSYYSVSASNYKKYSANLLSEHVIYQYNCCVSTFAYRFSQLLTHDQLLFYHNKLPLGSTKATLQANPSNLFPSACCSSLHYSMRATKSFTQLGNDSFNRSTTFLRKFCYKHNVDAVVHVQSSKVSGVC